MRGIPDSLPERLLSLFSSDAGEKCYRRAMKTMAENGMAKILRGGVLVGFSGGADSAFLLGFLLTARAREGKNNGIFGKDVPIAACHVHHGIRGEEADGDLAFSEAFAHAIGIEFIFRKIDVPALAKEQKCGMEETAREERYRIFNEIISGRNDLSAIALAHNATDQAETFLFRLMRGAGTDGLCSIPAVRENIVRPLLEIPSGEIRSLLDAFGIPYAVDSTNSDISYSRNFLRHEILPKLRSLHPDPEEAVARTVKNLSEDRDYLDGVCRQFLLTHPRPFSAEELSALHPAIFYRVFAETCLSFSFSPEECHIAAVREGLLKHTDFSVALPLGFRFSAKAGTADILPSEKEEKKARGDMIFPPLFGQNNGIEFFEIPQYGAAVAIAAGADSPVFPKTWQNVYKIAIQADLSSAIIEDGFSLRFRREGDSYRYKGMSHKLKKMMNDKEIPSDLRSSVPIFSDRRGIVWVPGFGVRDDGAAENRRIAVYQKCGAVTPASLHIPYRGVFFTEETSDGSHERKAWTSKK